MTRHRVSSMLFSTIVLLGLALGGCAGASRLVPGGLPDAAATLHRARHHRVGALLMLRIPAQHHRRHRRRRKRRPAYVSPNMRSLAVTVQLLASPRPRPLSTLLVVATPNPCTGNSSAGFACTFNVDAYVGEDAFTFAAYASTAPGPNDTPLSTYTSGAIAVSAHPSPLAFTLEGVVYSVALRVPDPEEASPGPGQNTQAVPIGTPTSFPLRVTPRDASGAAILTDTFAGSGITISASPVPGMALALRSQCPNDTISATSVTMTCAADLNALSVTYDGSVHANGDGTYADSATIAASPQPAASSVPAKVGLEGTMQSFQLASPVPYTVPTQPIGLALDPATGTLVVGMTYQYGYGYQENVLFAFDPSQPGSPATSATLASIQPYGVFVDAGGNVWVRASGGQISCFTGVMATPASTLTVTDAHGDVSIQTLTQDALGNLWYVGSDKDSYAVAGFVPDSGTCPVSATQTAQYVFSSGGSDVLVSAAPLGSGGGIWAADDGNNAIYALEARPISSSSPQPAASLAAGTFEGISSDPSGTLYVAADGASSPSPERSRTDKRHRRPFDFGSTAAFYTMPSGGATLSALASLSANSSLTSSAAFSGSHTTAQALVAADYGLSALDLLQPVASGTVALSLPLPVGSAFGGCTNPTFDAQGGVWIACPQPDNSMRMYHPIVTSTWSAFADLTPTYVGYGERGEIGIAERSTDSSPFTATSDNRAVIAPESYEGTPSHTVPILVQGTGTANVTIADKYGRTQTLTFTVVGGG